MPSHYDVLGVEPTATVGEIRRRFRELVRACHPDVSRDPSASHQSFIRITEAYQVLADPERRADYDLGRRSDGTTGRRNDGQSQRSDRRGGQRGEQATRDFRAGDRSSSRVPLWGVQASGSDLPQGLSVGTRVEADFDGIVLVCRVRSSVSQPVVDYRFRCEDVSLSAAQYSESKIQNPRSELILVAPPGTRRAGAIRDGVAVRLAVYQAGRFVEAVSVVREWVWTHPPLLVVGPIEGWRESSRRRALRLPRDLSARLTVCGGGEYPGRTLNVSAGGLSLLLSGRAEVGEGAAGTLTLQIDRETRCDDLPIRVARVRNWLRPAGRALEVGIQFELHAEDDHNQWQCCLARLEVER